VDAEYYKLADSLAKQAAELNEGDSLFDQYRIMHNVAFAVPAAKAKEARQDAEAILKRFLTKYYAAANDITPTEITRVEVEEAGQIIPLLEKGLQLMQALQATADPAERVSADPGTGEARPGSARAEIRTRQEIAGGSKVFASGVRRE
jgi:hypothetical protein